MNVLSLLGVLVLAISIIGEGAIRTTQAQRAVRPKLPNLSGTWRLNEALSANWSNTVSSDVSGVRITQPATLPAETSTGIKAATTDARVEQLLQAITTLEIFQRRRELVMNATGARSLVLSRTFMMDEKSDGNEGVGRRNPPRTRANWADKSFVIETTTLQGSRLKEIYEVSGDRLYLCVTIQSDLETRPTFVLRVYEKAARVLSAPAS
ncbi:MAG TPA: hypothetical protein VMZ30_09735 [Pyrinomonadaceae bacterium]|nr:hypothetical protein [Pyrinomonadaceae bacterium]